jgi:hypothetical protein
VVGASDALLRFDDPSSDGSSLRVVLEHESVHATIRIGRQDRLGIVRFFDALAVDWRGWHGERGYQSEDIELDIACLHDGIGEVRIHVQLGSGPFFGEPARPDWTAGAWLTVEPGALRGYASALRALTSGSGARH